MEMSDLPTSNVLLADELEAADVETILESDLLDRVCTALRATHEPCTELEEWRRLKTDRHAAHIACLRGVIALHPDDALHVGGTSRNELDALRASQPPEAGPACEHGYYRFCPTCHPQSACSSVTKGPSRAQLDAAFGVESVPAQGE
jgi:hypothetical protein